jgi:hypothetical protein
MADGQIETSRFIKKNSVQLLNNRLIVKKSSPFETSEFELSYDQIENKKTIETKVSFALIVFSSFAAILGFLYLFGDKSNISIVLFIFSVLFILIAFVTKLKVISIKSYDGRNIELYFTERNKEKVILFSNQIIDSANDYLLRKYSKIDKDLPVESQIQNLIFLRDRELLSEEKFEQLKNQLLGKENKSNIGYR